MKGVPRGVYELTVEVTFISCLIHEEGKEKIVTTEYIIKRSSLLKTQHTYDPDTGIANHPTDSELSFLVC